MSAGFMRWRMLRIVALAVAIAAPALPSLSRAQAGPSGIIGLDEEEARFVPGLYYFHKGCESFTRGEPATAMRLWQIAAGWAMKDAQYDLGIAYFRGHGVGIDRPRGLAWLALAAERKDAVFETSLAAAWDESTSDEQAQANAIWRELRKQYGDDVALPRARSRYRQEINQITGSRVGMPGHVRVWTRSTGVVDVEQLKSEMQARAERNFGRLPIGKVDIGPLQPFVDDGNAGTPSH